MAHYEKQGKQEVAYPIPISLLNCYRTVSMGGKDIGMGFAAFCFPCFS